MNLPNGEHVQADAITMPDAEREVWITVESMAAVSSIRVRTSHGNSCVSPGAEDPTAFEAKRSTFRSSNCASHHTQEGRR
jgi:hypothetical protein